MNSDCKILVGGAGSIARRHLATLRALMPDVRLAVWRQKPVFDGIEAWGVEKIVTREEQAMAWQPQAAIVASPAPSHLNMATALAKAGVHLMIEKPIAHQLDEVRELIESCQTQKLILMTAYPLRFHEGLRMMKQHLAAGDIGRLIQFRAEVGQYLPDWRPGTDYRSGNSALRERGGGALLELSHELDLARWMMGDIAAVSAMHGRLSDLEIEVEDTAEILLRGRAGCIGSVGLNFFQKPAHRACFIRGTQGSLEWTLDPGHVRIYRDETKVWQTLAQPPFEDMFVRELRHFLDCVAGGTEPDVTGEDGLEALRLVEAARSSGDEHREVLL